MMELLSELLLLMVPLVIVQSLVAPVTAVTLALFPVELAQTGDGAVMVQSTLQLTCVSLAQIAPWYAEPPEIICTQPGGGYGGGFELV
jgi:hypothetical protein